jgi:hypothetical protein
MMYLFVGHQNPISRFKKIGNSISEFFKQNLESVDWSIHPTLTHYQSIETQDYSQYHQERVTATGVISTSEKQQPERLSV